MSQLLDALARISHLLEEVDNVLAQKPADINIIIVNISDYYVKSLISII